LHLSKQSTWEWNPAQNQYVSNGEVYPFGVDPGWFYKNNQLSFFNSLKMKLSVILGVTQMTFGVFLSLGNHIFFKDYISIAFEFLPRVLFLFCTFGYMICIILYKWSVDWTVATISPPSLIQTMIKMFLSPGKVDAAHKLFNGQDQLQLAFLVIALLSIPWMLFPKPLIHNYLHKRRLVNYNQIQEQTIEEDIIGLSIEEEKEMKGQSSPPLKRAVSTEGAVHAEAYSFSDDFIHCSIHTIEYVLGTVSNTASYLRLWALSLAHSELSSVFWDKIFIQYGVESANVLLIFVCWAIWAGATFAVLLCMDVLECFLHALRLHWVEFQNKFYYADGYIFEPFTFIKTEKDEN